MSYIGNTNTTQAFTPAVDYFSGNASTTAFTLSRPVASVAQVQAVVNNVAQNPSDAFTVSGNTITFTSAPSSGTNNIYVYYTSPITQVIAPSQGTVGLTQLSATGTASSSTYLRGDNAWSGLSATDITAGTLAKARLPAGTVLQVVSTSDNTYRSTSATIPRDTSIPQITEGAEFLSLTITPTSATSYLLFHFEAYFQEPSNTADSAVFPLFKGSNASAIGGWYGELSTNITDNMNSISGHLWYANDTTSPTTYQVRYGSNFGSLQTLGNETFFATGQYGGIIANKLTVMEIAA